MSSSEFDRRFSRGGAAERLSHRMGEVVEYRPARDDQFYPLLYAQLGDERVEEIDEVERGGRIQVTRRALTIHTDRGSSTYCGFDVLESDGEVAVPAAGGWRIYSIDGAPGGGVGGLVEITLTLTEALAKTRPGLDRRR